MTGRLRGWLAAAAGWAAGLFGTKKYTASRAVRPSARLAVVASRPWEWMLYAGEDGRYFLSVVCGTVGLSDRHFTLPDGVVADYRHRGRVVVDEMARRVRSTERAEGWPVGDFGQWPARKLAVEEWIARGRPDDG
jgi:hypothetical protein